MTTSRSSWVAAIAVGAVLAPAALRAQDTQAPAATTAMAERAHVVKEGDTLWDLARTYLGDPFLWPEIYRLNTKVVEDPHWIYPGESLRIPGGSGDAVAAMPAASTPDGTPMRPAGGTIFAQRRLRANVSARRLGDARVEEAPVVRQGEFEAAPFMSAFGGPNRAGRVLRSGEVSGIAAQEGKSRFLIRDEVYIDPPVNRLPTVGDRYLAYRRGPSIGNSGQVMIPTGVLVVDRTSAGEATLAHVESSYDEIMLDQGITSIEPFPLTTLARPTPVEHGMTTKVLWAMGDPVLPSIGHYLVLEATSHDGVSIGDQFTLYTSRDDAEGRSVAPRAVATLRVVRVTANGTTVLVKDQQEPQIRVGMLARLTAKMP